MRFIKLFIMLSVIFVSLDSIAQKDYDGIMYRLSVNPNARNFMSMGYYINSNNIAYLKTGNNVYLERNIKVIQNLQTYSYRTGNVFKVDAEKGSVNYSLNNKEVPLYEGYLFQYIGEFFDILERKNLLSEETRLDENFLKSHVDKWIHRSLERYGDYSLLFRERIHMGAQWALAIQYLYKLTNDFKYLDIVNEFNTILRTNLRIDSNGAYIWNSTYDKYQNAKIKGYRTYPPLIQDVSHGNHVVNYIISSYENGIGDWSEKDIERLVITFRRNIYRSDGQFSDNIDGSLPKLSEGRNNGWKFTDGWMKLSKFDNTLQPLFEHGYRKNEARFRNTLLDFQYQSLIK